MKEHFQDYGVRKWAGDDLIELQSEPLAALQALVEPYAPCIIQGCEVTDNGDGGITVSPGLVALKGKDSKGNACVKIARFAGIESATSIYLTLECETVNRLYGDGKVKDIAYDYKAVASTQRPDEPFLEISGKEVPRLVDTIGITQKLDREGGDASELKVVSFQSGSSDSLTNITTGSSLKELFGKIREWLSRLKALAFKDKVGISDIETTLANKLNGIEANANKYTHPTSAAGAKTSGLYKIATDAGGHITEATAVGKSDITALGIPAQDTVYTHPTTAGNKHIPTGGSSGQYLKYSASGTAVWSKPTASEIGAAASSHSHAAATATAAGLMSAADKTKLDGIATGANAYTHPTTAGNKHIPTGGSTGQYLKYSASGTAVWNKPTASEIGAAAASHSHAAATESSAGFMSAADKAKLNSAVKTTDFRPVGFYIFDSGGLTAGYGYNLSGVTKASYNSESCIQFTLSTSNGFLSGKTYMCIGIGSYQHTADVYAAWIHGGESNYIFERKAGSAAVHYGDHHLRMLILECNW